MARAIRRLKQRIRTLELEGAAVGTVITRALGHEGAVPELFIHELRRDDVLLLCTGVHVFRADRTVDAVLCFDGARVPSLRSQGDHIVVSDDCGRVLVLATRTMNLVREERVS